MSKNSAPAADAAPPPPPPPSGPNSEPKGANVDAAAGTSTAKGTGTGALGDQVHPDTMLNEADGNRTLMKPRTDPGPVLREGTLATRMPDRSKGEHRYSDTGQSVGVTMRTSTGHSQGFGRHDGDVVGTGTLPPDSFVSGAASDMYNPEGRENTRLSEQVEKRAAEPKEVAPTHE